MESCNKPSPLSLNGNLAENWRRFQQQFEIFLAASGREDALLLNFAGEDAIELFNTFKFETEEEKKRAKDIVKFRKELIGKTTITKVEQLFPRIELIRRFLDEQSGVPRERNRRS